jgi:hypothetical protein
MHRGEVVNLVRAELGNEPATASRSRMSVVTADADGFGSLPAQPVGQDATVLPVASDDEGPTHPETISSSGSGR